jgi:hypothetical protein
MQHERVAADELLGGLAVGEDAHGAVVPGIEEGPASSSRPRVWNCSSRVRWAAP